MNAASKWMAGVAMLVTWVGVPGLIIFSIVRRVIAARRERAALRQRVHEAIEKITADGRIEGPKGRWHPHNWAAKWLGYSYGLRMPKSHLQMHAPELPKYPHPWDEE